MAGRRQAEADGVDEVKSPYKGIAETIHNLALLFEKRATVISQEDSVEHDPADDNDPPPLPDSPGGDSDGAGGGGSGGDSGDGDGEPSPTPGTRISRSRSEVVVEPNRARVGTDASTVTAFVRAGSGTPLAGIEVTFRTKDNSLYQLSHDTALTAPDGKAETLIERDDLGELREDTTNVAADCVDPSDPLRRVVRITGSDAWVTFFKAGAVDGIVIPSRVAAHLCSLTGPATAVPTGDEFTLTARVVEVRLNPHRVLPLAGVEAYVVAPIGSWSGEVNTREVTDSKGEARFHITGHTSGSIFDLYVDDPLARPGDPLKTSGSTFVGLS